MPLNPTDIERGYPSLAGSPKGSPSRAFFEHTRCAPSCANRLDCQPASTKKEFFEFGGLQLFGRVDATLISAARADASPGPEASPPTTDGRVALPFNPTEIIDDLRLEIYVQAIKSEISYISNNESVSRRVYYALRPFLPVAFRRILQRVALKDWTKIPFPRWPVDTTVEDLIEQLWILLLQASGEKEVPFIWYWPKGFTSCGVMTHDVETAAGQDFCVRMLEIEKEFGVKSSFEFVPEVRYEISESVVNAIRLAGSEVCIHGLNHDGKLFSSEQEFRRRVKKINGYAKKLGAIGFRSPVMYRNPDWYDAFEFSYDMSFPNVAHLDPQRGGCCTIFPYFIGHLVELPLTTIQDYPLYNILRSDPLEMWSKQLEIIHGKHGMASFIVHPDYTVELKRQKVYRQLLELLRTYQDEKRMWLTLPREVDRWWRQRNELRLERETSGWIIRGPGAERAQIAYARLDGQKLRYVTSM
jgi:peptidoglycan/xylan/chitin deacetylase (PgdA/CDA1 family)